MSIYEKIEIIFLAYLSGSWVSPTPIVDFNREKMDFALKEVGDVPLEVDARVRQYFVEHETLEGLADWADSQ